MQNELFPDVDAINWLVALPDGTHLEAIDCAYHQRLVIESPEGDVFPYRANAMYYFPNGLRAVVEMLASPQWDELQLNAAMAEEDIDKL